MFKPVTLVTLFRSYDQFYRAECITVSGFFNVLPKGGSFVGSPFGALLHESRVFQFFNVLPQGGSFVTPPLGAMGHESRVFQFFIVLPQGGSFVGSPLGALRH